jgi:hypothetical protein
MSCAYIWADVISGASKKFWYGTWCLLVVQTVPGTDVVPVYVLVLSDDSTTHSFEYYEQKNESDSSQTRDRHGITGCIDRFSANLKTLNILTRRID